MLLFEYVNSQVINSMIKSIFLIFNFIIICNLFAFSSGNSISGILINSENQLPILNANVFLSGTTLGGVSDEYGKFEIRNIPNGSYELVISHIVYQLKSIFISLSNLDSAKYQIKLNPRVIKIDTVTILGEKDEDWEDNYELFNHYFLGPSENSARCEILNRYVLNFNRTDDTLIAQTDSILRIENKSLGYDLNVILQKFIYDERNNSVLFMYKASFAERYSQSKEEKNEWQLNRLKSYYGSFYHFMSSISRNKSRIEGFSLKKLPINKYNQGDKTFTPVRGYGVVMNHNSLIQPDQRGLKQFSFSGYLQVDYLGSKSGLILDNDYILIDTLGMIHSNPISLTRYGAWAETGIADIVPINYRIENNILIE